MKYIYNKYSKFLLALLLFFFGSIFQVIPILIFNLDANNIGENTQILLTLFSNTIIAFILILFYFKDIKNDIKKFKENKSELLEIGFKIWVIGLILMASSNVIIKKISPNEIANNEEAIRSMISVSPYLMLINTAILAPIVEELVFRKSFRTVFKNNLLFVIVSGIVFGGLHVVLSIENVYDYLYLIPYCSLGISLSYMYYKADNICIPIIMHMIHNFIITVMNILVVGLIIC